MNKSKHEPYQSRETWFALKCKICSKKASWSNESTGSHYCTQCMEDVALK